MRDSVSRYLFFLSLSLSSLVRLALASIDSLVLLSTRSDEKSLVLQIMSLSFSRFRESFEAGTGSTWSCLSFRSCSLFFGSPVFFFALMTI